MALEVEDGTAKSDAESYVSVAEASAYHSLRGNTLWATMSEGEMEAALRRATDYLVQTYRDQWAGYRATTTQALDWPREEVQIKDAPALSY
ncbi:MAG TPA: DnaT-like ssDNA-binding protein, partial [Methylibium sp.]|nr:DnaT-like ssDNA-binding protein [Methylibium sp.]